MLLRPFYHLLCLRPNSIATSPYQQVIDKSSRPPRFLTTASNPREDAESCPCDVRDCRRLGEPSKGRQEMSNQSAGYVRHALPIFVYSCPLLCSTSWPMRRALFCFCARGASDTSSSWPWHSQKGCRIHLPRTNSIAATMLAQRWVCFVIYIAE